MLKKFGTALLATFLLFNGAAHAYDLPKLKPDKEVTASAEPKKGSMLKSDWSGADLFEQQIRARLESGERLAPDDPARVATDPNYIFIAFRDGAPYFLDKYSIKIRKNSDGTKVWEQKIFPITKKFSPRNAVATNQRFCLADGKFYNAFKKKNALADLSDEADRIFLEECFRVGYYFAFGHEAQEN